MGLSLKGEMEVWKNILEQKENGFSFQMGPMVQAPGTSSHFLIMIQIHESHWGNFGSRDLEDQEVYSVKL